MSNFTHYNGDPLYAAAAAILEGRHPEVPSELEEGVEEIKKKAEGLKVGDKTNFGVVVEIGKDSVSFKAKDLPKTKISFNQRKTGSKDFVLDRLMKLKEGVELVEGKKRPLPKDIEDYANKIEMFSHASVIYNGMMDIFGNLNLPKEDISAMVKRALDDVKKIKKGKNESVELEEGVSSAWISRGDNVGFKKADIDKMYSFLSDAGVPKEDIMIAVQDAIVALEKRKKMRKESVELEEVPQLDEDFIKMMNDRVSSR